MNAAVKEVLDEGRKCHAVATTRNISEGTLRRYLERRGSVVVITSAWHAAGRWFDSRTRHVSLLGVKTWLSKGIVYL